MRKSNCQCITLYSCHRLANIICSELAINVVTIRNIEIQSGIGGAADRITSIEPLVLRAAARIGNSRLKTNNNGLAYVSPKLPANCNRRRYNYPASWKVLVGIKIGITGAGTVKCIYRAIIIPVIAAVWAGIGCRSGTGNCLTIEIPLIGGNRRSEIGWIYFQYNRRSIIAGGITAFNGNGGIGIAGARFA